jgi:AcrR family transcriptional regulator
MPKLQRKPDEIQAVKDDILQAAVELIADIGFMSFSMRKLAVQLKITATTIYNYYQNKDELFIAILNHGFKELYAQILAAHANHQSSTEKLRAMMGAYTDYGLDYPNFYNLMYSWHVPKYNDYIGTTAEPTARHQYETAMQVPRLFFDVIKDCASSENVILTGDQATFLLIHYWSQVHGFIAGCNNGALSYVHNHPAGLKNSHLDRMLEKFLLDIQTADSKT